MFCACVYDTIITQVACLLPDAFAAGPELQLLQEDGGQLLQSAYQPDAGPPDLPQHALEMWTTREGPGRSRGKDLVGLMTFVSRAKDLNMQIPKAPKRKCCCLMATSNVTHATNMPLLLPN